MLPSGLDANSRSYAQQYAQQPGSAFTIGAHGDHAAQEASRWHGVGTQVACMQLALHAGNLAGALQAGGMQASQLGVRWDGHDECASLIGRLFACAAWGLHYD